MACLGQGAECRICRKVCHWRVQRRPPPPHTVRPPRMWPTAPSPHPPTRASPLPRLPSPAPAASPRYYKVISLPESQVTNINMVWASLAVFVYARILGALIPLVTRLGPFLNTVMAMMGEVRAAEGGGGGGGLGEALGLRLAGGRCWWHPPRRVWRPWLVLAGGAWCGARACSRCTSHLRH